MSETKIQWTDYSWNPAKGCDKISEGCKYCVSPDTLILYTDWTWKPIKNAKVGDEIIAFDEYPKQQGHSRRLKTTIIEAISKVEKEALKITTKNTQLICSFDHAVLQSVPRFRWIDAGNLRLTNALVYIGTNNTHEETMQYKKGYISGMTAGDGTYRWNPKWGSVWKGESPQCYWRVALSESQMEALEYLKCIIKEVGIAELTIKKFSDANERHQAVFKLETRSQEILKKFHTIVKLPTGKVSLEFKRGWLAGIFDAEGNCSNVRRIGSLRIANYDPRIIKRVVSFGKVFGFDFRAENFKNQVKTVRLYGKPLEKVRFFTLIHPKISYKRDSLLRASINPSPSRIVKLESEGIQPLIDIQTSAGTFIANGLLVHNCYMMRDADRYGWEGKVVQRTKTVFTLPLKLKEHQKIFTSSWTDIFHEDIDSFRDEIWDIIRQCPHHSFQVLTKRADRIEKCLPDDWGDGWKNVWLGISAENQKRLNERSHILCEIPAHIRFISAEPLLEAIDFIDLFKSYSQGIHQVIVGGESGNENGKWQYRPCELEWIVEIIRQCKMEQVPVFVKQLGTKLAKEMGLADRHGGNIEEFPDTIQLREFPVKYDPQEMELLKP